MRSSTASGSGLGPALKLKTRWVLRDVVAVEFTLDDSSLRMICGAPEGFLRPLKREYGVRAAT